MQVYSSKKKDYINNLEANIQFFSKVMNFSARL